MRQTTIGMCRFTVSVITSPDDITSYDPVSLAIACTGTLAHRISVTSDNSTRSLVTISVIWAHNSTPVVNALVRTNQIKMENFTDSNGMAKFAIPDNADFFGNVTFEAVRAPENITTCLEK